MVELPPTPLLNSSEIPVSKLSLDLPTPVGNIHPTSVNIVEQIRNSSKTPDAITFDKEKAFEALGNMPTSPKKIALIEEETDLTGAYSQVSPGEFVPKYETYFHGLNNEDLYSRSQSAGEQIWNGVSKNTIKALTYVLDGTAGTVTGLVEGLKEGSLEAGINNSLSKWVDEQNKRLDYKLPNYISDEQKNMGFVRSMGTANFWANDFAGGLAFMVGALGSEALWAAATGGSSLALSGAKWGARMGGKALLRAGLASEKGLLATQAKQALSAYSRTIAGSNTLGAINNIRFMGTSAGFESGVESRSSFDESMTNFQESIKISEGRLPTSEEYAKFIPEAVEQANRVFGANMAILIPSNLLQFGKFFGVGQGLVPSISKAAGKSLFGVGLSKAVDGTRAVIKATKLQKGLGKTVAFLRNPVVEGFEEGAQGTVSRMSQNLLASKYDPTALKENYTNMEAFQDAFAEAFGSREGFKEVGIGMLIGKFGDFSANIRSRGSAGLSAFNRERAGLEAEATKANTQMNIMSDVTKAQIQRLALLNQQTSATNKSVQANKEGKLTEASQFFDQAQFAKMLSDHKTGMLNDTVADFKVVIAKADSKAMAEELGVELDVIDDIKSAMVKEYASNVKTFKKAYGAAEALGPQLTGLRKDHYVEEVASNFYLGVKSMERTGGLAESIELATGQAGFADMLKFYSSIDKNARKNVTQLKYVATRLENLQKEYGELQQQYSILQETKPRVEENKGHTARVESNRKKAANVLQRQNLLQEQKVELEAAIDTNPLKQNYAFGNLFEAAYVDPQQLVDATDNVEKLDGFIEQLEKKDRQAAENLRYLVQEYTKNQKSFEAFHDVYQKLTSPEFNVGNYKGIAKLINNKKRFQKPTKTNLTPEEQAVEQFITDNKMDDYEAFNFRLFSKVSEEIYKGDFTEFTLEDFSDPIEEAEWTSFVTNKIVGNTTLNSIAQKIIDNDRLSNRERRIQDFFSPEIELEIKKIKKAKGDSLRKAMPKPAINTTFQTTSETLRDLISQILASKNYLQGIAVSDIEKEDIPTEDEYREINKLQDRLEQKGILRPKDQRRYDELSKKINEWGAIEGTFSGKHSLGELYNQLFALEKAQVETVQDETAGVVIADVMNGDEIEAIQKRVYYNILQTYDKAFFSRDENGVHIHNVNLDGFVQSIVNDIEIDFIKVDGKTKTSADLSNVDFNTARIEYKDREGNPKTILISRNAVGALTLTESGVRNLNADTSIQIGVTIRNSKMPTNYFTVLKRVVEDGKNKMVPLASNFFDNTISSDPRKVQQLKKGDTLSLQVDLNHQWNKKLMRDYKKDGDVQKLEDGLVIRMVNDNNLVGVLKSNRGTNLVVNQNHYDRMAKLRREAVDTVLQDPTQGVVDLASTVRVERVFLGHPVLNIEETAEGKHAIIQNRFTEETSHNITDIGYILDGKMNLRNTTDKGRITESYVHAVMKNKNGKYTGRRVPIVIINHNGRNIAYPVTLIPEIVDNSFRVDEIINTDLSPSVKAIRMNELLMQNGIDVERLQIRNDNYLERVEEAKRLLSNQNRFVDLTLWLQDDTDISSTLMQNAVIDLDMRGDLFHSPKVTMDFGPASTEELSPEESVEAREEEDMDEDFVQQESMETAPIVIEEDYSEQLAGIKDQDEFTAAVIATDNDYLIRRYTMDPDYAKGLFDHYSQLQKIPVMQEQNGEIVPDIKNDTQELFRNTVKSRVGNFGITANYELLQNISEDVWYENPSEVKEVLSAMADNAAKIGVDVTTLPNMYDEKPQIEIMAFLENLVAVTSSLNLNIAQESDLDQFAIIYDDFFGVEQVEKETIIPESDLNLVQIHSNLDEVALFERGYVHVRDNIYQKVEKDPNAYETLYEMAVENPSILPQVAYYPSGFDRENRFQPDKVKNQANRLAIQSAIKRYVQKVASDYSTNSTADNKQSLEEIVIFKLVFKHPIVTINESINTNQQYDNYKAFDGDITYLTGEFLADFHTEQMIEKAKDSPFYRNVLSHFEITDTGLRLINPNAETVRKIGLNTPNRGIGHDLRQYSIISKDKAINNLFDNNTGENIGRSITFFRNLYLNNPKLLAQFKGKVSFNGDILELKNVTDNFVRVEDKIYEKVGETANVTHYKEVVGPQDLNFNIINPSLTVNDEFTPGSSVLKVTEGDNFIEITPLYRKSEKEDLDQELDACS